MRRRQVGHGRVTHALASIVEDDEEKRGKAPDSQAKRNMEAIARGITSAIAAVSNSDGTRSRDPRHCRPARCCDRRGGYDRQTENRCRKNADRGQFRRAGPTRHRPGTCHPLDLSVAERTY